MKDGPNPVEFEDTTACVDPHSEVTQVTADLRILATTDIHMQLLGHDYVRDIPVGHAGFAGLATLIKTARAEAAQLETPCLLADNGDILQGSALGELLARMPVTKAHPIVAGLDRMRYDAIGVGNHDIDHGLPYLQQIAAVSQAPFLSSNLVVTAGSAIRASTIVRCRLGPHTKASLNIGFLSVLPAQTGIWNKPMLDGLAHIIPPQQALSKAIPQVRAQGADIIILLAHMGIEDAQTDDDVRALTKLKGVDAMIAGHTHRRLPGQDHAGIYDVDINKGALGPYPAAMPGFNASDLAVLDLRLVRDGDGVWQITEYDVQLRENTDQIPADPEVSALFAPAHQRTRADLAAPVGHSVDPLHNFFSLAAPTPTCALTAAAKARIVAAGLCGTPEADLPLLVAVPAHTAGGRGGPDHFLNIPPGKVYRRALAGLSPYGNRICALRITGDELRDWLEHKVSIYTQLQPGSADQPLLRADHPTFHFDTVFGLRYGVDLTQPRGARITELTCEGACVAGDQRLILATNQFRAAGGGGGAQFDAGQIIFGSDVTLTDALLALLRSTDRAYPFDTTPWYFDCAEPVQAVLQTSPQALQYLDDIAHLSPKVLPTDTKGFMPLRLTL